VNKKRGLGKGLEALIPTVEKRLKETGAAEEVYREVEVSAIIPAPGQARKQFDEEKMNELAASIKEHGVLQPVILRSLPEGGYQLIAGERRWRACKKLNLPTIPAIIKEWKDQDASAVSLIENVQRENLGPLEEAEAYRRLIKDHGLTQEVVSGRVGKSRSFVANMVRLLDLSSEVKDMLAVGRISSGHARALLAIHDPREQLRLAQLAEEKQLNVRQTEKAVSDILLGKGKVKEEKAKGAEENKRKSGYVQEIEIEITQQLGGMPVRLRETKRGSGKLEIGYGNREELKRILEILLGKEYVSRETEAMPES